MEFLPWLQLLFILAAIVIDTYTAELPQSIQIVSILAVIIGGKWLSDKFDIIKMKVDALVDEKRNKAKKKRVLQQIRRRRAAAQRSRWSVASKMEVRRKREEIEIEAEQESKKAEERVMKMFSARADGVMRTISMKYATKQDIDMESEERVEAYDNARGRMDMLEAAYQSMRDRMESLQASGGSTSAVTVQPLIPTPPRRRGRWRRFICV